MTAVFFFKSLAVRSRLSSERWLLAGHEDVSQTFSCKLFVLYVCVFAVNGDVQKGLYHLARPEGLSRRESYYFRAMVS